MRIMFGINDHMLTIDMQVANVANEPQYETQLWEMQRRINEMVAKFAELQRAYGYTWVGNPETGEWHLEVSAP